MIRRFLTGALLLALLTANRLLTLSDEARRVDLSHEALIRGWPRLLEALRQRPGLPYGVRVAPVLNGAVGYAQLFLGLPWAVVAAHMLFATLVWVAVIRVRLGLRTRGAAMGDVPKAQSPADGGTVQLPAADLARN